jgi:hypothetical protein
MQVAGFDRSDVFVIGHAAIDNHGAAFGQADARPEQIEHGGQCGAVLGIARADLMGDREAVALDDEADHHWLAVRAVVARIATFGFVVGRGLALEIGRGQVVEIDRAVEIEPAAFALDERGLNGGAMEMELVEDAVERVLGHVIKTGAEDISQGSAADPLWNGMLGGRLDQPVEDHRAGPLTRGGGDAKRAQDIVQIEAFPELVADMDGTGFAMAFGVDPVRVDRNGLTLIGGWRAGQWRRIAGRRRSGRDLEWPGGWLPTGGREPLPQSG